MFLKVVEILYAVSGSLRRFAYSVFREGNRLEGRTGYAPKVRAVFCFVLPISAMVFSLASPGLAQTPFGLNECLRHALTHSPVLEKETLEQKRTNLEYGQESTRFLPDIQGYVNYQHYFSDLPVYIFPEEAGATLSGNTSDGPYPLELGLPHNVNAGVSLRQVVLDNNMFLLSKLRPEKQKLDELNMAVVRDELIFNVASTYYRIALLEEKLGIIDYNLGRLGKLREMLKLQIENDFATQSELLKLDVRLFSLQTDRRRLINGIDVQKQYFKLMMGMAQQDTLHLRKPDAGDYLHVSMDTVQSDLNSRLLQQQQVLLGIQKQRIRADLWPTLNLFAHLNLQAQRPSWNFMRADQPWYNIHYWGLSLDIPVMQGLSIKRELQLAEIRGSQLKLGLDQSRRKHRIELEQARMEADLNRQLLEDQRAHLDMAQQLYEQAELKFNEGTIMLKEYLEAEALLAETKVNYQTQAYEKTLAALNVMKLSGTLTTLLNED